MLMNNMNGNVALLRLDRPNQANALNRELFLKLKEELDALKWNDNVRAVVISGSGKKAFCAGIDLKERAGKTKEEILREREMVIRPFYLTLGDFPKPTIAALNGPALGGGAELALTCDLRVASPLAKFGQTEIRWGMIPSCGACQRLRLIAGMGVAKEIILTGRVLEAEEACRLGIYNRIVPLEKLDEDALNLAREISGNPPFAVKQAKKALEFGADISGALDFDFEASKECFFAGDALDKAKTF
jgi:enoyl-CoA hydratase/carnithine racemase